MTRSLCAIACASLLALLPSCSQKAPTTHIGVLVPLTGGAASYGQNARKGVELALKEYSSAHADTPVELVVEDSRGEPAFGVQAATKLIDLDRAVAIIGCVTSGVTLAVAPIVNEKQVPIISPGASSPNLTDAGDYVYRTWPSDVFEAQRMTNYIRSRGFRRVALLRINNEYGLAMENAIRANLTPTPEGPQITAAETFDQGVREMRTQLLKIAKTTPDAIYFIGFPEAAVVFGKGYSDVGLSAPVLATSAFEDPQVAQNVGSILDGSVYTKPVSTGPRGNSFRTAYKTAYGEDPGIVADTSYDAAAIVLEAIVKIHKAHLPITGQAVRNEVASTKDYSGVSGTISFDANGDVLKPVALFVLRAGQFVGLEQ